MKLLVFDIIIIGMNIKFVIFISILRYNEEYFFCKGENDLLFFLDMEGFFEDFFSKGVVISFIWK